MDYPTYVPFLELATNADARRRVWMAKSREGGEKNLKILEQALQLRYELAQLHGQPDFASYALKRRMAQTPAAVYDFLGKVKAAADPLQAKEFGELRAEKARLDGTPLADTKLNRWDVNFLKERVRKARYSVDQEALRAYFPTEASVQYAMRLASSLYGVEFVARDVPRWHSDVRYYDVYDRAPDGKRGAFVGGIYLDLFPRDGKYNHAAAFPVRGVSTLANRTPISVLVANLNAKGLNHEELETLLHEYGHVLHGVLSKTRYVDQSRHVGEARLRRGAVADVRGVGAARRATGTVCADLSDLPATDKDADRPARRGTQVRARQLLRTPGRVRAV